MNKFYNPEKKFERILKEKRELELYQKRLARKIRFGAIMIFSFIISIIYISIK